MKQIENRLHQILPLHNQKPIFSDGFTPRILRNNKEICSQYKIKTSMIPSINEKYQRQKEDVPNCGQGVVDLSKNTDHYGTAKNRPFAPGFGVPLMNFDENPLEQYKNKTK